MARYCCPLSQRAATCHIWFTVTLVHGNIDVAAIMTNCIQLWQNICVLEWWIQADFSVLYVKGKIYKHGIWLKLNKFLLMHFIMIRSDYKIINYGSHSNATKMFLVMCTQNVLSNVEFTTCLKQDREKWYVKFHTCANLFLSGSAI